MIPSWANREVYNLFDAFIQTSILNDNSFITDNPSIFSVANLDLCVAAFVDNPDLGDRNFDEKSRDQFANTSTNVQEVFAHFIWLWSLSTSDMNRSGKKTAVLRFLGEDYDDKLNDVFLEGGIGSAGQRHKLKKPREVAYLLLLFRDVKNQLQLKGLNDVSGIKAYVIHLCRELRYNNDATTSTTDDRLKKSSKDHLALHHILLHLCDPHKYEAIAAQKHKDAIVGTFYSLLDKDDSDGFPDDIDENIYAIRKQLDEIYGYEVSFYEDEIHAAWNFAESAGDNSEVALFEYKKAMIFYGPPGTSKTYSAERLAKALITRQYFRKKEKIKEYFETSDVIFKEHIHHIQLHSNYNYEDFIAGLQIEDKSSVVKPGYLLQLIEKVQGDKLPHILILDEINRTDISRLFGELFSALEYRNKPIDLSVGKLKIALPENLHFIGTMNEIDFSLERVDFALRRRFLWVLKSFDKDVLIEMIKDKRKLLTIKIDDGDIEVFVSRCERLNEEVAGMPELGRNYQVGHTFFAEIVPIFKSMKGVYSGRLYFLQQPVKILWEISIRPILQAFLGNMDADAKSVNMQKLEKIFTNA